MTVRWIILTRIPSCITTRGSGFNTRLDITYSALLDANNARLQAKFPPSLCQTFPWGGDVWSRWMNLSSVYLRRSGCPYVYWAHLAACGHPGPWYLPSWSFPVQLK